MVSSLFQDAGILIARMNRETFSRQRRNVNENQKVEGRKCRALAVSSAADLAANYFFTNVTDEQEDARGEGDGIAAFIFQPRAGYYSDDEINAEGSIRLFKRGDSFRRAAVL